MNALVDKATLGFRIDKIWQILKCFAGTFRRAQTLKLGGANPLHQSRIDIFKMEY